MQRSDAACLRDFRKVQSIKQERPFVWKSPCKQLGCVHKLDGDGSQGSPRQSKQV